MVKFENSFPTNRLSFIINVNISHFNTLSLNDFCRFSTHRWYLSNIMFMSDQFANENQSEE